MQPYDALPHIVLQLAQKDQGWTCWATLISQPFANGILRKIQFGSESGGRPSHVAHQFS